MWFKSLVRRFRSGSHSVDHDGAAAVEAGGGGGGGALEEKCWEELPLEVLRNVLERVEQDQGTWPSRKDMVACAGVCRAWRTTMRELVRVPQAPGRLTFPISVKQPGPRDTLIQCFIKRNRSAQTYQLYLRLTPDAGKFLLAAKRCGRPIGIDYVVSLNSADMSKGSDAYIGTLSSRLLRTNFVVYESVPQHVDDYVVSHIAYEVNELGTRGPRNMRCVMDSIPASAIEPYAVVPTPTQIVTWEPTLVLRNKAPVWHGQLQGWCLNFNGRVAVASMRNFQLVASVENGQPTPKYETVRLQFGKVGNDLFIMDYQYPLSAFQAFAICLSSFDTKVACE